MIKSIEITHVKKQYDPIMRGTTEKVYCDERLELLDSLLNDGWVIINKVACEIYDEKNTVYILYKREFQEEFQERSSDDRLFES